VSWRPGGAAALREEAEAGLGVAAVDKEANVHVSPPRIIPFALAAALICGLSGIGVLPPAAAALLDLGAAGCYLVALRSALPRWPELPWPRLRWLNGMAPAALPLAVFATACIALAEQPGLPGVVLLPLWVLLLLTVCPWLEVGEEQGSGLPWTPTALAVMIITVPLPLFALAMSPSVSAPVRALAVGGAVLIPTWRLVSLSRRSWWRAWRRSITVAVLLGAAAGASVLLRVPIPLLPVALLLGWYGLSGVVSQRDGRSIGGFAVFVVLAAVMLAVASPV
jgi:hypothetical protein